MQDTAGWTRHPLEPAQKTDLPEEVLEGLPGWRRQWDEIWYIEISGRNYVFRAPTRGEAIKHDQNLVHSPGFAAKEFVDVCLLHPESMPEEVMLSEFDGLYKAVWVASGFKDQEVFQQRLDTFLSIVYSPDHQVITALLLAFPWLSVDEINTWQPEKITYHLALARFLLESRAPEGVGPPPEAMARGVKPPYHNAPPPEQDIGASDFSKGGFFDWNSDLREQQAFDR
jgi:hypothetical protein